MEKLYVSAPASLSPHPTVANYFTVDLAVLKELSQELADLFGLTLPIPWKKLAYKATRYQIELELHVTASLMERIGTSS